MRISDWSSDVCSSDLVIGRSVEQWRRIPVLEQAGAIAMQNISVDTVCYIIIKAREYDVKTAPVIRDPASNPSDDGEVEVLQDDPGDPTTAELSAALRRLNRDEMKNGRAQVRTPVPNA